MSKVASFARVYNCSFPSVVTTVRNELKDTKIMTCVLWILISFCSDALFHVFKHVTLFVHSLVVIIRARRLFYILPVIFRYRIICVNVFNGYKFTTFK